jgi:hypothetical protein
MADDPLPVLAVVRDLMFVGRITAEARAAGATLTVVRDPAKLADAAPARLLIADLNLAGALDAAAAWRAATGGAIVGFVAHTDVETITRARAAGIDRVMARSQFVQVLPGLLAGG